MDREEVRAILEHIAGPQGQEDVVNAGKQLIAKGFEQGEAKGRAEGEAKGEAKGRAEGEAKGLRQAITTALSVRGVTLGGRGRARLASCADPAVLTRWLERSLTAAGEDDVFDA